MKKNGFRYRYVLGPDTDGKPLAIPIRVLYCKLCQKVTSILPSFCIPYKVHTVLTFDFFFHRLFFTMLSLTEVVTEARGLAGYYQLAQAWIRSFKDNTINLTAEIRSLLQDYQTNFQPSLRCQELFPTWQDLQRLARCLGLKSSLEKTQYVLWQKKKLTIFAYLG